MGSHGGLEGRSAPRGTRSHRALEAVKGCDPQGNEEKVQGRSALKNGSDRCIEYWLLVGTKGAQRDRDRWVIAPGRWQSMAGHPWLRKEGMWRLRGALAGAVGGWGGWGRCGWGGPSRSPGWGRSGTGFCYLGSASGAAQMHLHRGSRFKYEPSMHLSWQANSSQGHLRGRKLPAEGRRRDHFTSPNSPWGSLRGRESSLTEMPLSEQSQQNDL